VHYTNDSNFTLETCSHFGDMLSGYTSGYSVLLFILSSCFKYLHSRLLSPSTYLNIVTGLICSIYINTSYCYFLNVNAFTTFTFTHVQMASFCGLMSLLWLIKITCVHIISHCSVSYWK